MSSNYTKMWLQRVTFDAHIKFTQAFVLFFQNSLKKQKLINLILAQCCSVNTKKKDTATTENIEYLNSKPFCDWSRCTWYSKSNWLHEYLRKLYTRIVLIVTRILFAFNSEYKCFLKIKGLQTQSQLLHSAYEGFLWEPSERNGNAVGNLQQ